MEVNKESTISPANLLSTQLNIHMKGRKMFYTIILIFFHAYLIHKELTTYFESRVGNQFFGVLSWMLTFFLLDVFFLRFIIVKNFLLLAAVTALYYHYLTNDFIWYCYPLDLSLYFIFQCPTTAFGSFFYVTLYVTFLPRLKWSLKKYGIIILRTLIITFQILFHELELVIGVNAQRFSEERVLNYQVCGSCVKESAYLVFHLFLAAKDLLMENRRLILKGVRYSEVLYEKFDDLLNFIIYLAHETNKDFFLVLRLYRKEVVCAICLDRIKYFQSLIVLPCHHTHIFHDNCIKKWFRHVDKCPLCRAY